MEWQLNVSKTLNSLQPQAPDPQHAALMQQQQILD